MEKTETPKGEVWKIVVTTNYAEKWLSGLKKLCRILRLCTLTLPEEKTIFVTGDEGTALVRCLASLSARFPKELKIKRFDLPERMQMRFEWEPSRPRTQRRPSPLRTRTSSAPGRPCRRSIASMPF